MSCEQVGAELDWRSNLLRDVVRTVASRDRRIRQQPREQILRAAARPESNQPGWGIPFKEDPNATCPRSGGLAEGAARESENDPGKKNVPPWRHTAGSG